VGEEEFAAPHLVARAIKHSYSAIQPNSRQLQHAYLEERYSHAKAVFMYLRRGSSCNKLVQLVCARQRQHTFIEAASKAVATTSAQSQRDEKMDIAAPENCTRT
jgi:hypothetical protein